MAQISIQKAVSVVRGLDLNISKDLPCPLPKGLNTAEHRRAFPPRVSSTLRDSQCKSLVCQGSGEGFPSGMCVEQSSGVPWLWGELAGLYLWLLAAGS